MFGQASRGRKSAGAAAAALCAVSGWSVAACWGVCWGVCSPSPPTPLPRFTGARGDCVFELRKAHHPPRPWKGRGAGGEGYTPPMHPSPRGCCIRLLHSRAGGEEQRRKAEAVSVLNRPFLLSTFSHLLSMAWVPLPPHPRPLSPVSRGRGGIVGEPRTGVRGCSALPIVSCKGLLGGRFEPRMDTN